MPLTMVREGKENIICKVGGRGETKENEDIKRSCLRRDCKS